MPKSKKYSGFSLIEILIVVGLILILAAITIVAINPAKHFRDTRNSQRSADISEILNAASQFIGEEGRTISDLGTVPVCGEVGAPAMIGTDTVNNEVDLDAVLVPKFIVEIPSDPRSTSTDGSDTGYTICRSEGDRLEIGASMELEGGGTEVVVVKR